MVILHVFIKTYVKLQWNSKFNLVAIKFEYHLELQRNRIALSGKEIELHLELQ